MQNVKTDVLAVCDTNFSQFTNFESALQQHDIRLLSVIFYGPTDVRCYR